MVQKLIIQSSKYIYNSSTADNIDNTSIIEDRSRGKDGVLAMSSGKAKYRLLRATLAARCLIPPQGTYLPTYLHRYSYDSRGILGFTGY